MEKSRGKPLTDKQEKFVMAVVEGMTQFEAYKTAYNAENMKEKTIREKACNLMAQDNLRTRYEELRAKVVEKMEEKAIVTVEDTLKAFVEIRNTCMKKIPQKDDKGNVVCEKFVDATTALKANDSIAKALGMFTEKIEHSGETTVNNKHDLSHLTAKEIKALLGKR